MKINEISVSSAVPATTAINGRKNWEQKWAKEIEKRSVYDYKQDLAPSVLSLSAGAETLGRILDDLYDVLARVEHFPESSFDDKKNDLKALIESAISDATCDPGFDYKRALQDILRLEGGLRRFVELSERALHDREPDSMAPTSTQNVFPEAGNKHSQKEAGYESKAAVDRCESCRYFLAPNACKIVEGKISASGTCHFFRAKLKNEEIRNVYTTGIKNALSKLSIKATCSTCGYLVPKYPGRYPKACPNCEEALVIVNEEALRSNKKNALPEALTPFLENIREEIRKRTQLFTNLESIGDNFNRHEAIKAALSCLTRVVVEDQKNGKGILEAIAPAVLVDLIQMIMDEDTAKESAARIRDFFLGEK